MWPIPRLSNHLPCGDQDSFLDRIRSHSDGKEQRHGRNDRHLFELRVAQQTSKNTDGVDGSNDITDQLADGTHPARYMKVDESIIDLLRTRLCSMLELVRSSAYPRQIQPAVMESVGYPQLNCGSKLAL